MNKLYDFFSKHKLTKYSIQLVLSALALAIGVINYYGFQFTSDGFHNYSTIRNISEGLGPFEGPTFEYMLGNHSFLIFYVIAPLIYVFTTPLVLLVLSIFNILTSSILVYKIAYCLLGNLNNKQIVANILSILFFFFPITFSAWFFNCYMFQTDSFLAPLCLLLIYAFIKDRFYLVVISTTLFLLVKEESIVLYPAILTLLIVLQYKFDLKGLSWDKKKIIILGTIICLCSLTSILFLFHYQELNVIQHVKKEVVIGNINTSFLLPLFYKTIAILVPIVPFVLIFGKKNKVIVLKIVSLLLITIGLRLLLNIAVYNNVDGSIWANNILSPLVFILLILAIKSSLTDVKHIHPLKTITAFTLSFTMAFYYNIESKTSYQCLFAYETVFTRNDRSNIHLDIHDVRKKVNKGKGSEYIILPEWYMYPFMERSHVSIGWICSLKDKSTQNKIIQDANYIIILKNSRHSKKIKEFASFHKSIIYETKNFLLYK